MQKLGVTVYGAYESQRVQNSTVRYGQVKNIIYEKTAGRKFNTPIISSIGNEKQIDYTSRKQIKGILKSWQ